MKYFLVQLFYKGEIIESVIIRAANLEEAQNQYQASAPKVTIAEMDDFTPFIATMPLPLRTKLVEIMLRET